jgi:activator of 2-hydroxyglutaryl-CoA dehydratase
LFSLFLCGCTPLSLMPGSLTLAAPAVLALLAAAGIIVLSKSGKIPAVKDLLPDPRFNEENITHTFIAALPTLTREMNLEVASSKQTEVLERSDARRFLGIDLGTNHARMAQQKLGS